VVAPYRETAASLGADLARRGIGIVYGGGSVGLMNEVAEGALACGGEVIGVITEQLLALEVARLDLTALHVVRTMHERKQRMSDLADGFVALPGGFGTLDELFEAITWTQLGLQTKPAVLYDVDGFWDPLVAFVDRACAEGFIRPSHRSLMARVSTVEGLLTTLANAELPAFGRWVVEP
jgi:hypothetical protein